MRQGDRLSAVLIAGNLCNRLGCDIAGRRKTLRTLDHCLTDHRSILQHVLQIDQGTVIHMLGKVICIMKMDQTFFMCFDNLRIQQDTLGNILADLSCHIITLYAVYNRILIGIFLLYLFVVAFDQAQNLLIC